MKIEKFIESLPEDISPQEAMEYCIDSLCDQKILELGVSSYKGGELKTPILHKSANSVFFLDDWEYNLYELKFPEHQDEKDVLEAYFKNISIKDLKELTLKFFKNYLDNPYAGNHERVVEYHVINLLKNKTTALSPAKLVKRMDFDFIKEKILKQYAE